MAVGEPPQENEAMAALDDLNNFLMELETRGVNLFRRTQASFPLQNGVSSYTLSNFPLKVYEARYRNSSSIDLPMSELRLTDYLRLPQKTSPGIPTQFTIDSQTTSATMYVWCVPVNPTVETIQYTYIRRFQTCQSLTDSIDCAPEWQSAIVFGLAKRMMAAYGTDQLTAQMIATQADELLLRAKDFDRPSSVRFRPAGRNMV
jgi:hypothetical protein